MATVSCDGKLVLTQGSFNLSPSGGISEFAYAAFQRPNAKPTSRGGIPQTPFIYQVHPGPYWIGNNMIFTAPKYQPARSDLGQILIPDLSQNVVYALTKETLTAYRLDARFTELDQRRAEFPPEQDADFPRIYHMLNRHRVIGWTIRWPGPTANGCGCLRWT